jgi:hypothetical protein
LPTIVGLCVALGGPFLVQFVLGPLILQSPAGSSSAVLLSQSMLWLLTGTVIVVTRRWEHRPWSWIGVRRISWRAGVPDRNGISQPTKDYAADCDDCGRWVASEGRENTARQVWIPKQAATSELGGRASSSGLPGHLRRLCVPMPSSMSLAHLLC